MTSRQRAPLWGLVLALAGAVISGTACRRAPPGVATALTSDGLVQRLHDGAETSVVAGSVFTLGDLLRTGPASGVRLALIGGGVLRVGENARLRFQPGRIGGEHEPDIAVELGSAEIEESAVALTIMTAVGPTRVAPRSRVRVRADARSATVEVIVGRAVMLDGGREIAMESGQGLRIRLGGAETQRFAVRVGEAVIEEASSPDDAADAYRAPAAEGARDVGMTAASGARETPRNVVLQGTESFNAAGAKAAGQPQGSGRADITLVAGESATVHDARPPSIVRLRVEGVCDGEAIVDVGGRGQRRERLVGARSVLLRLETGVRAYTVRCAVGGVRSAPRAAGALTIRRDSGYVPIARRPPANVIDADGRKYTILFQTRLPQLTFAWPSAPAGGAGLDLHVQSSAGGELLFRSVSPDRPLSSGTIQEGTYTLWYSTSDGKQSPKTIVTVRFDNAAPTAQFFRSTGDLDSGATVIDGVAVEGTRVSVGGESLALDRHGRFRMEARPLEGDDAVAIRLEHPRSGIHYYVRRASTR